MTGDPSWIRGEVRPRVAIAQRVPEPDPRRRARRGPPPRLSRPSPRTATAAASRTALSPELLHEMMEFLGCRSVGGPLEAMFVEDMQFDGADGAAISWGDEVPAEVRAASPVVVIGCGLSGILAGIRLSQAGLPFTIIEKNDGPGRDLVGEPLSRRACRRRQPPVLLLVRARRPLERVLLPAAGAARLLRRHRRQVRSAVPLPVRDLRHVGDVGRVGGAVADRGAGSRRCGGGARCPGS